MGKKEKLIAKIETKPIRSDILFDELEQYYNYFGYYAKKQNATSHIQFVKSGKRPVTVKKQNPVKCSYVKQAIAIVHDDEEV